MKVYGITEIARALDVDPALVSKWRERAKLPAADAELSLGPVWLAETIEPVLEAGGPPRKLPGGQLTKYKITARMKAGPYPAVREEHQARFTEAIAALHSKLLLQPGVEWEGPDQALVVLGCVAPNRRDAETMTKSIIMRNAQSMASIAVKNVEIVEVTPLGEW